MTIRRSLRRSPAALAWTILLAWAPILASGCASEEPGGSGNGPEESAISRTEGGQSAPVAARGDGETATTWTAAGHQDDPAVLFFGTSLTAGYGLPDPGNAFPALIQARIDSAGMDYRVVNAGVPGETSAAGLRRIGWILARDDVDALVLELGANDGLRGQDPDAMRANLQAVIDSTRAYHPDASIVVAGMEAPPNLGPRYVERFRSVFAEVAEENDAALIPFLLEGVAGDPELNQSDRIHPTGEGHRRIAETVWETLEGELRRAR